jgi:hypothetical protein
MMMNKNWKVCIETEAAQKSKFVGKIVGNLGKDWKYHFGSCTGSISKLT